MSRPDVLPEDKNQPIKLRLEALRWVDGDYDQWGAYWGGGSGDYIYCAWDNTGDSGNENCVRAFVRASCRRNAKAYFQKLIPGAIFYR